MTLHSLQKLAHKPKVFSLTIVLLSSVCLFAQSSGKYSIIGDVNKVQGETITKVYLKSAEKGVIDDSCTVKNGIYSFKGTVNQPTMTRLFYGKPPQLALTSTDISLSARLQKEIFIEPATIKIVSGTSFTDMLVTGSTATKEWDRYLKIVEPYKHQMAEYFNNQLLRFPFRNKPASGWTKAEGDSYNQYINSDEFLKDESLMFEIGKYQYNAIIDFINKSPASPVCAYLLKSIKGYWCASIDEIAACYERLSPALKATPDAKYIKSYIYENQITAIGKYPPMFAIPDSTGKLISLSDFKGKYVLIDFWSSTCGPCLKELPNVIEQFHKYKDKGFVVLAVSADETRQSWLKAIYAEGTADCFINVCDFKPWKNHPVMKQAYHLNRIPANFLVDPTGKIVGRHLYGNYLSKKLAEVYK